MSINLSCNRPDPDPYYALFNADGSQVIASTIISNPYPATNRPVYTCYNSTNGTNVITWDGYDSVSMLNYNYFAIFTPTPAIEPVTNLSASRLLNRFANYGEYFNRLTWKPSSTLDVVNYRIYNDWTLVATLSATATSYEVHNQPLTNPPSITYQVTAIDGDGNESPASVSTCP